MEIADVEKLLREVLQGEIKQMTSKEIDGPYLEISMPFDSLRFPELPIHLVLVPEEEIFVILHWELPIIIDEKFVPDVLRFVNVLNAASGIGGFGYDEVTKRIYDRHTFPVFNEPELLIKRHLQLFTMQVQMNLPTLILLADGETTCEEIASFS